ncbi:RcnB family protein [Paraburkholderia sp. J41]|uniref:RcnB family protein n=1 Tax=Paraburkholderia sp. J41 TaxID=2805433 RepID=UPI002AC3307C|nr:RcnB family protein [Paraburkholderia sp. J41]
MNRKTIARCLLVAMLGTSASAFAQPHGPDQRGGGHGDPRGGYRGHGAPMHDASIDRPGGPVPHSDWHKGERLPGEYRDRNYVVDDWHGHGLSAPPRGYHWVGVNGDYVLAAIATGLIANVVISAR